DLERSITGQRGKPARYRPLGQPRRRIAFPGQFIQVAHESSVMGGEMALVGPGLHRPFPFGSLGQRLLQTLLLLCSFSFVGTGADIAMGFAALLLAGRQATRRLL